MLFVLVVVLLLLAVGVLLIFANGARMDRQNAQLVDSLFAAVKGPERLYNRREDLEGLPPPVQRYFAAVLREDQPFVRRVRLLQKGQFRIGDASRPWRPLKAVQHFTSSPPGFVWDATITMAPLLPVRVVDMYLHGEGGLWAKVLSTVTMAHEEPAPALNKSELMRYLAEAVWFPTALLPAAGVRWKAVDEQSAEATVTDGRNTVSLLFSFNSNHEVERIYAPDRPRSTDGAQVPTPWQATYWNYEFRNGLRIPLDAEVRWLLPDGDLPYWQGHIAEIEHEV